jgi:hypothetical protein
VDNSKKQDLNQYLHLKTKSTYGNLQNEAMHLMTTIGPMDKLKKKRPKLLAMPLTANAEVGAHE